MRALPICLAAAALALAAAPAAQARHPRCRASAFGVTVGRTHAGAGQRFATLILRNGSARSCRTFGFVGMLLLDRRGRAVPTHVVRVRRRPRRTILLQPGDRAFADLRWGAIAGPGEPADRRCERRPTRVEVTPPDAVQHLVTGWHGGPVCEHGRIEVQPLRDRR